jgi:hypothetical protein
MTGFLTGLIAVAGVALLLFFAGAGLLYWIARGEPDVNGDIERDSGAHE